MVARIGRVIFWLCVALGALLGIDAYWEFVGSHNVACLTCDNLWGKAHDLVGGVFAAAVTFVGISAIGYAIRYALADD